MRAHGFTLIELVIAIAIVAILAALAYPSYLGSVRQSRRAAAESYLMDVAQREQQYLLDARAYAPDLGTLNSTTPASVSAYYTIQLAAGATPPTFTVSATPSGDQMKDSCGNLSLDNNGTKTASGGAVASCW